LDEVEDLTIIGSTATSDFKPRLFRIDTPALPLFFSGTGDMFAALTIPRLIEAVKNAPSVPSSSNTTSPSTTDPPSIPLFSRPSWKSPDDVPAEDLPLAQACQKVLASMQAVLAKTAMRCEREMKSYDERAEKEGCGSGEEDQADTAKRRHLALTNASEVKVVRHVRELMDPPNLERFRARRVVLKEEVDEKTGNEDRGSEQGKIEEKQNGQDVKNAKADVQKSEGETEIETQEEEEKKPSQAVRDS
jgi:pyridoxine kinase